MKNLYFTTAILLTFSHINAADFGNQLASADTPLKTRHQSEVAESVGRGSSTISVMSGESSRTNTYLEEMDLKDRYSSLKREAIRYMVAEAKALYTLVDLLKIYDQSSDNTKRSVFKSFLKEVDAAKTIIDKINLITNYNNTKHAEINSLIEDITTRQTLLQDSTTKNEAQTNELNRLNDALEVANMQLTANLKNQEETIAQLEDEIKRLRASNEGRDADAAEKEQLAHEFSEFKTKLYAENKELSDLLATMVARPTEHMGTEFSPERQDTIRNADIQSSGYVKQLTAELASTKAEHDVRVREVEAAEAKAQQLATELAVSKADRDAVNAALEAKAKEVEAAEAKAQQLTAELAVSKTDHEATKAALEAKAKEVEAAAEAKVQQLTAELETTKADRDAASAELNKNGTAMIDIDHRKDSVAPDEEKNQGCFYCTVM